MLRSGELYSKIVGKKFIVERKRGMATITPDKLQKQLKNEENTKRKYITPIIEERWGKDTDDIVMEYYFTAGLAERPENDGSVEEMLKAIKE